MILQTSSALCATAAARKVFLRGELHVTRRCESDSVLILMERGILRFCEDGAPVVLRAGEYYVQRPGLLQEGLPCPPADEDPAVYVFVHFAGGDYAPDGAGIPLRGTFRPDRLRPFLEEISQARDANRFRLTARLFLILAALAGCAGKTTPTASSSDLNAAEKTGRAAANELVVGIAQDFDSLDPDHMTAAGTKEVLFNVFEGLVKPTSAGDIVPAVASAVEKSADGLSYVFTLREGVKFHNGNAVTMDDVVYSIERRRNGEDAAAKLAPLDIISGLEPSADGKTLTVTLSEPSNEFLAYIMNAYILPADYADQETAPVGTGPYKFVSRAVQDNLVLERFADYWGQGGSLDKVTFKILESAEGLVLGLQSGALDLVAHLTTTQTKQLNAADFKVEQGSMNLVQALYLNNAVAPFDDVRVRQALCYAISKQ